MIRCQFFSAGWRNDSNFTSRVNILRLGDLDKCVHLLSSSLFGNDHLWCEINGVVDLFHACVGLHLQSTWTSDCGRLTAHPFLHLLCSALASHTDVAGLAAGVLLGINSGQTHQLVPADLSHCSQSQVYRICVDHLQDDILCMVKYQTAITLFILLTGKEAVVGEVKCRKPLLAEVITSGTLWCQDEYDVMVGCIHAVEVSKVEVSVGIEEHVGTNLIAVTAIGGVLRRLPCIEFCVATKENSLQLATDRWPMTTAVVLHWWKHLILLHLPEIWKEKEKLNYSHWIIPNKSG